ncbi:MAG: 2-oxo acid dehydrogenase subunit E2, partial [Aliidongia sp.]
AAPVLPAGGERIVATPLAKRMAAQAGLNLGTIAGSGPHGRIVKADIEAVLAKPGSAKPAAAAQSTTAMVAAPAPSSAGPLGKDRVAALAGNAPYQLVPHTGMRKTIAKRLTEAKQTIPHFYLTVECEIDELLKIRADLNGRGGDYKLSVNDFVIRASALALKKVPEANASWSDDGILLWDSVDVAVAVAIDGGLITPIVKRADTKGLAGISNEMKDLGARAKSGKLKLEEFQGGTFSISNLGMFGIKEFSAVINPPHGAILAVGAGEQRPIVKNGALGIATVMSCTLSVDHRVVDGATGARFLQAFKRLIEDPLSMLL